MKKLLITISVFVCLLFVQLKHLKADETPSKMEYVQDTVLSEDNVYLTLLFYNIKYPDVVMSQIMIESAYFTSKLFKSNNNLLGMTIPSKRQTTALNKNGKYAQYSSWIQSILDYKYYQDWVLSKNKIDNKKQYIAYLHKNYAKSPTYKSKLTKLSQNYELRNPHNFKSL